MTFLKMRNAANMVSLHRWEHPGDFRESTALSRFPPDTRYGCRNPFEYCGSSPASSLWKLNGAETGCKIFLVQAANFFQMNDSRRFQEIWEHRDAIFTA